MLGGSAICGLSVDNEGLQSEQDDGDKSARQWNNMAENWVQNEMMTGHKIVKKVRTS